MLRKFFLIYKYLIPTNGKADILKLLVISVLFTSFFLVTANLVYDTDGGLFLNYSNALAYGSKVITSVEVARYDIVYPALLLIALYPFFHSFILITIINAIMSVLIPLLVYLTLKPTLKNGAFYMALIVMCSLSPYYYMKWIRPDHAFIFFNTLSIYFLNVFFNTNKIKYLYALTIVVIIASLTRAAGNIFFPIFLGLAFLFGRGSLKHYAICILIGIISFSIYSYHRYLFFGKFGEVASFNGGQIFQNLYLNSQEMGLKLEPAKIGPVFKSINDNFYKIVSPSPAKSILMKQENNADWQQFAEQYIAPFNAQEFMEQIYLHPAWDYNEMLYDYMGNDNDFLKASIEIFCKYPWYPFAYTARNLWKLLYDPGWVHSRYNINPFGRTGIDHAFPFDHSSNATSNLNEQSIKEINFDVLKNKPVLVQKIITHLKNKYCEYYLASVKIIFFFMLVAWLAIIIKFAAKLTRIKKIAYIAGLMPKNITPIILSLTIFLFINMAVISAFVDPQIRFHNHMFIFKIMLAGIGVYILRHIVFKITNLSSSF